jgi:hypothetical protein
MDPNIGKATIGKERTVCPGVPSHVKRRSNDDRFPLALWEVWFCSQLGVPIPELMGPLRQCPCNAFQIDYFGDHLQTCQGKSAATLDGKTGLLTGLLAGKQGWK